MFKSKPRLAKEFDLPDPIDWQDSRYFAAVRDRMMAAHFCTFSASTSMLIGIYALDKGVWPIAGLMATGALTACIFAFGCASLAYQWQKHDRIMRRESERTEREALTENGRLWREINVTYLDTIGLLKAVAAGADADGGGHEFSPSADVLFMNPKNGRRH